MNKTVERAPTGPLQPAQGRVLAPSEMKTDSAGNQYLTGATCGDCSFKLFPPSTVCPECLSLNMQPLPIGTTGRLYCYTKVHVAPPTWVVPYFIGYVDMPEGVRLFGKIEASQEEDLKIDMPVTIRFSEADKNWRYFFSATH